MDELITSTGVSIDLKENVPIPLNLSIADFKEPSKRQRNFSKEIDVPGTANNMAFFASAFNVTRLGGTYDFNSSEKVNCTYLKRGAKVLPNAVIQLKKIVILEEKPMFKILLFSDFVDTFLVLSNTDVRELNWSSYGHILSPANIASSWGGAVGTGYYYPLIERNQRLAITQWRVNDMVPYVHLVDVFKKCMDLVGQKYTSNILATTRAKSVLYGYGGGEYLQNSISPGETSNRRVELTNGILSYSQDEYISEQEYGDNIPFGSGARGTINYPEFLMNTPIMTYTQTFNPIQQWVAPPNRFTAHRTGAYKITIVGSIRQRYTGTAAFSFEQQQGPTPFVYKKNGVSVLIVNLEQTAVDQTFPINLSFNLDLVSGDQITFALGGADVRFNNGSTFSTITRTLSTPTPIALRFDCLETSVVEGSFVEVGRMLPSMKCSEFVLGVIRLFNLMVSDPDIYGVIRIEDQAGFYQGTDVFTDITSEVDNSREIEIRPSANEYGKKLSYLWKTGTETDAKNYISKWGRAYGDLSFDQPSFFAKGEQKIELPFGTIIPYQVTPSIIAPRFVDIDNAGVKKSTSGVPRLMFRNGLKTGTWQLRGVGINNYTTYPSVHHFDNWEAPTFDLNWALVSELLHTANVVTSVNSYSVGYFRFVNEVISKDGKYVILYRRLNQLQIEQIDWTKLLMWNGALFRFNAIMDFDSEITEVTKIEMLKVLEAQSPDRIITPPFPNSLAPIYKGLLGGQLVEGPPVGVATSAGVLSGGTGKQVLEIGNLIIG